MNSARATQMNIYNTHFTTNHDSNTQILNLQQNQIIELSADHITNLSHTSNIIDPIDPVDIADPVYTANAFDLTRIKYQIKPLKRKRPVRFQEKGWHTTDGFLYEANRLSRCVEWARRELFDNEFTYFVSLNITQDISVKDLKKAWSKVSRHLKNNHVVALWVCELSPRSNHFNFHLLLRSNTSNIKDLLKNKFGKLGIRTNIKSERFDPKERHTVAYMTKAKIPKYKDGKMVSADRWESKRVLFIPGDKIRKYGFIGKFFPEGWNKVKIWAKIIEHERKIREGLSIPRAEEYAEELFEFINGYYSLKRVSRAVGIHGVPDDFVPNSFYFCIDNGRSSFFKVSSKLCTVRSGNFSRMQDGYTNLNYMVSKPVLHSVRKSVQQENFWSKIWNHMRFIHRTNRHPNHSNSSRLLNLGSNIWKSILRINEHIWWDR